jgi:hypothetical protein
MAQDKIKTDQSATLLDRMAIAALISIYSGRRDTAQAGAGGHVPTEAARMAYEAAQAMMEERKKYKVVPMNS